MLRTMNFVKRQLLTPTPAVDSYDCDFLDNGYYNGTRQWTDQGCSSRDTSANAFGDESGGVCKFPC